MLKTKRLTIGAILTAAIILSLLLSACSSNNGGTPTGNDNKPPTTSSSPEDTPGTTPNTPGLTPDTPDTPPDSAGQPPDDVDMNMFPGDIERIAETYAVYGGHPYILYGGGIYIFDDSGSFYKVNQETGEELLFYDNAAGYFIVSGWVYFTNWDSEITHSMKIDGTGKTEFNGGGNFQPYYINDEYVYYKYFDLTKYEDNLGRIRHGEPQGEIIWENFPLFSSSIIFTEENGEVIYFSNWNYDTSKAEVIKYEVSSGTITVFDGPKENEARGMVYNGLIYYGRIVDGNNVLFRSEIDGTGEQNITPMNESAGNPSWGSIFEAVLHGNYLICEMVMENYDRYYYLINLDTLETIRIEHNGSTLNYVTPYKGYIYFNYYNNQTINGIHRINADGTGITQLCDGGDRGFIIFEDWIYFFDGYTKEYGGEGLSIYKIKTDGTGLTTLYGPF